MIEKIIEKLRDPKHWSQGRAVQMHGTVKAMCIGSAVEAIPPLHDARPYTDKLYSLVAQAIDELYPEQQTKITGGGPIGVVVSFNDHPYTTHEHVMKVLERARQLETIEMLTGVSFGTVMTLKHSIEGQYNITNAGPIDGKYAGFIVDPEMGRPIVNTAATFNTPAEAEEHMRKIIEAARVFDVHQPMS